MSADREKLRETLESLHEQLEDAEHLDEQTVTKLHAAVADINAALERERSEEEHESLRERLEEAAVHLEDSHPMLYGTVSRLVDILAQLGI